MDLERKKGRVQLVLVILFIVGAITLSKIMESSYEPPGDSNGKDRVLFVETKLIESKQHRVSFKTTGVVEAKNEINIVPEISGRVVSVAAAFFEGGTFTENEVLFQIDPRDFELEVQRLEAEVARAQTALDLEQAEANAAVSEWTQLNRDKPAPSLVARQPQLAEAKANLKSAQAQLRNAQLDLERASFLLPFNGRVLNSDIAEGQYVTAGQSYGKVFDRATLEVRASLEGRQLEWLLNTPNPEITFQTKHLGQTQTYQGVLKRGASSLDTSTRFASVRFGFKEESDTLLPGVFSNILVYGPRKEKVMLLPSSALQSQGVVWIVEANQLVRWEPQIIYASDHYIAVEGKTKPVNVVTSRVAGGTEGMNVLTDKSQLTQEGSDD